MRTVSSAVVTLTLVGCLAAPLAAQGRENLTPEQRAQTQAEAARALQEQLSAPRPIEAFNSVWIEELTWMEVRDLLAEGTTTVIIPTGGMEQNGPYLATGKHNYVLQGACEGIARKLGNALCAPIVKLVPEGDINPPTDMMRYPGTITLRQETYEAVLTDVGNSLKAHGFENIVFIGDSGGNQTGMEAVAARLNAEWTDARAHYIPEFYRYRDVFTYMETELGIVETERDGFHDDYVITTIMMVTDPDMVRYEQRVKAGLATINGLSIDPKEDAIEIGRKLLQFRADETAKAINAAISGS